MLLQNVLFFCYVIVFSGVSSGKDINHCYNPGISSGDAFSRDSLDSSSCMAGKWFWVT